MIGFVVPIKSKYVSRDWGLDNHLLERTMRSICAQTDQNFRLFIIYNEMPEVTFTHPHIVYLHFPFRMISSDEMDDFDSYISKHYTREYAEKMMDKGKKILYGCKAAMVAGCDYMMAIDSDDLISKHIAAYVNKHARRDKAGWRITKGFIYEENSFYLQKKYDIQNLNGSTHIIRKDLIDIPDFASRTFWDYNLFESHGYTAGRIWDFHKERLEDYPYFGIIYIIHSNNYSPIRKTMRKISFKNFVKKFLFGMILTRKIRIEFGL
jgi:hypothetical protein